MRLPDKLVEELLKEVLPPHEQVERTPIFDQLEALRKNLKDAFDSHQQPMMTLLEEMGQFYIELERNIQTPATNSVHRAFLVLSARLRSDFVSLCQVILVGQLPGSSILARSLIEVMETSMAIVGAEELAEKYVGDYAERDFWEKNIGYGKVYSSMRKFYAMAGAPEDEIVRSIEQHRKLKSSLSGHVHASEYSSVFSTFQPTVLNSDGYLLRALGSPDPRLVRLVLHLVVETSSFAFGLLGVSMQNSGMTADWLRGCPSLQKHIALSAYVFDEIMHRYGEEIDKYFDSKIYR